MTSFAAEIVPQIRAILAGSDLSKVSAKAVRKELIARGHDEKVIKESRGSIDARVRAKSDEQIEEIYEQLTSVPDAGSASSVEEPLSHPTSSLPQPLRAVKQEVKQEVKPDIAAPVNPAVAAETDAEMAARLQREFNTESNGRGARASRSGGAAPKKKAVKRKSKPTIGSDGEPIPKKKRAGGGGGAFNKELMLSDALIALVNEPRLSRPQVVKRLWEYIKANQLQDPSDGRYILCDEPMRAVFHTDKLHMFTMNKILANHVRDPDEIANGQGDIKPKTEGLSKAEIDYSDDDDD